MYTRSNESRTSVAGRRCTCRLVSLCVLSIVVYIDIRSTRQQPIRDQFCLISVEIDVQICARDIKNFSTRSDWRNALSSSPSPFSFSNFLLSLLSLLSLSLSLEDLNNEISNSGTEAVERWKLKTVRIITASRCIYFMMSIIYTDSSMFINAKFLSQVKM